GGFHRYAVDARWLVPHFEKMLYDNAQLPRLYLEAYQVTGEPELRRIVEETLDYVLRDMRHPEGGFYSATDADSEGEEGKYFVWTPAEVARLVDPNDVDLVCRYWDISEEGNFDGKSIPHVTLTVEQVARMFGRSPAEGAAALERARTRLLAVRGERVPPARDEERLIARSKPGADGSLPSGNAVAAHVLLRLHHLTGEAAHRARAEEILRLYHDEAAENPFGHATYLEALELYLDGPLEVVVVGRRGAADTDELWGEVARAYLPHRVLVATEPGEADPPAPARARPP